jgi:glycosyltransferase involved in cell wall biosynthesis
MQPPVLWIANPLMAKHIGTLGECLSVFDAIDDWASHPQKRRMRRAILDGYDRVTRRADVIFCVSRELMNRLGAGRTGVHWMPNGVDAARFAKNGGIPSDISALPKPIVGYVGVLQERIDVGVVAALSREMSRASIVLVGPVVRPRHFAALSGLPNVHLVGERPHAEIPSYLHSFDVCILPHTDSPLTRSMNPLKAYEYLAAGKPTVASGLADFEAADGLIRKAICPADFVRAVREVADHDDGLAGARRRFAEQHSWNALVERMLAVIRTEVACGRGGSAR